MLVEAGKGGEEAAFLDCSGDGATKTNPRMCLI